ncbi:hypothetical protein ACGGZK_18965 [Agromyces sp. MMS24-K17]|uniref:hypothetical protein n=1 Tax=Agromyces sp. MMS24-K17 TaxID=3372850 RepID=UPI0037540649
MTAGPGSSGGTAAATTRGRFARVPTWVWIALAAVVVVGIVLAVMAAARAAGAAAPVDSAEDACRSAIEEHVALRGGADADASRSFTATERGDGDVKLQGTVTFTAEDGGTHHADARCIVSVDGGSPEVVSVRLWD